MNNKASTVMQIEGFLASDDKCLLLSGTNFDEKHKIVMSIINKLYDNKLVLFRAPHISHIHNDGILGWVGINEKNRKNLLNGKRMKIGSNIYECDDMYHPSSWHKTSRSFFCAIIMLGNRHDRKQMESIENVLKDKNAEKVFLVTNFSSIENDLLSLGKFISRHVIYDAEDESPEKHARVLELQKQSVNY